MGLYTVGEDTYLQGISASRGPHYGLQRTQIFDFSLSRNLKNEI